MSARLERTRKWHSSVLPGAGENRSVEDMFAHLLRHGKVEEALAVFRAHFPFQEFDPERIPALLQRHLPHARKYKLLSHASFTSLLRFLQHDISSKLSLESSLLLGELAQTQANEILQRVLPDEYEHLLLQQPQQQREETLRLCIQIASCGRLGMLQELVEETLALFTQCRLLRPARALYCIDDEATANNNNNKRRSAKRRFEMDCEAMLWRAVDTMLPSSSSLPDESIWIEHAKAWCSRGNIRFEPCVSSFFSAHPQLLRNHPSVVLKLVELIPESDPLRSKAVALCISNFAAPFPAQLWDMLQSSCWEREIKQMRIREVASKYHKLCAAFDVAKHLVQLERHVCVLAASASDSLQFQTYATDLFAISAQYEHARLALLVIQFASHNIALEEPVDRVERIQYLLSRLPTLEERLHVCQEAVQYMLACCEDEDEQEVDRVLTANWGETLCHFVASELTTAYSSQGLVYLDLDNCEETFRRATAALLLDVSAMLEDKPSVGEENGGDHDQDNDERENDILATKLLGSTHDSERLDELNDWLVMQQVRTCCEKSLTKQNLLPGRFRDCPNVLEGNVLIGAIESALESKRRGAHHRSLVSSSSSSSSSGLELDSYAAMFFREGAYQLALRFKAHILLHFHNAASNFPEEVKLEYMLTTLLRNGLDEEQMDEGLVLGYLFSVGKRDTVTSTLATQVKRFKYDNDEYFRFERLCWMGKLVANTWKDNELEQHYLSKERVFFWFKRLRELGVEFDRLRLFEFHQREAQEVCNRLFAKVFDFADYQAAVGAELDSFLTTFQFPTKRLALAQSLVSVLLGGASEFPVTGNTSAVVFAWSRFCDLEVLLPALDTMSLAPECPLDKIRLALDVLVEHTPTSETYLARILLVELFGTNFAHFVAHPVQETHKLRGSFQSYTELELVRLVCTGLPLHRLDFVRQYTLHQVQSGNDVAEVLLLVEDTSLIGEDDHFRLSLVLELKQACAECKDQLELVRFAHSLFPRKQELQREMDVLERRAIFQDFGLKFPFKTTGMEEEDNDGLLLRIFYEQCAGGGGKETQRRGMLPAALVLMRGNVDLWKKRLQRCVVDWLQASLVEFDVVEVIVCALQHMQREAGVDPDQFLTGIAFMATARIKKIAIVRALRALGKFRALVFKEEDLLWMKEKELEMAECGIWKQKIEQVVQTANKPSSVLGLLREIPQTGVSPEKEVRGLRFVSGLIVDFSLYEDGLLETCLGRLVEASPSSGLQVMLDIPAQHLGAVKDLAIWRSLCEHVLLDPEFVVLLERCPFDDVVVRSCELWLERSRQDDDNRERVGVLLERRRQTFS